MQFPPEREGGRIVEGETAQEKAVELVRLLHEEAKVIKETFEKCSILFKFKEDEDFNRRHTPSISRIALKLH